MDSGQHQQANVGTVQDLSSWCLVTEQSGQRFLQLLLAAQEIGRYRSAGRPLIVTLLSFV